MKTESPVLNIDELARTDPLWQKVLEQEVNTPHIKMFSLMSRLNGAQLFAKDTILLYQANSKALVKHKMRGVPELVSDRKFWKGPEGSPTEPSEAAVAYLIQEMEKTTIETVEKHYPRWVLNQCLVSFCTILDSFLDSTLDAVLQHNPKILYGTSEAKQIELKKLVELGTVEAVVRDIRSKEIKSFSNGSVVERLDYFKRKLSIETNEVFDWRLTDEDTDRRLESLNLDSLVQFYQQRHDIVHRDATPIANIEEIDTVSLLFGNVGAKLAWLAHKKHGVELDFLMWAGRHVRYELLKRQSG
jgi:hypothetical protein